MAVDMAISATEKPLVKVFTSDYQLTIPSFQRAYTWQAENIEQLVNDLQDACADPDTPYFLGSLILVKDGPTQYQVIDGQQRLISLSIIVSVLRELEDDPDLIDSLNDLILEPGDKLRGIKAEPRLTLRERDTDFFRMYVQEGDLEGLFDLRDNDIASHAQRNIAVNTRRTFDLLAAMDAKDRRRFASYLVNGVTLVIVTTDDLAGAHRIFDVMNMRGVPLTASVPVLAVHATSAVPVASRIVDNDEQTIGSSSAIATCINALLSPVASFPSHSPAWGWIRTRANPRDTARKSRSLPTHEPVPQCPKCRCLWNRPVE